MKVLRRRALSAAERERHHRALARSMQRADGEPLGEVVVYETGCAIEEIEVMSESFFRVFRYADAPEELTELAPGGWNTDAIVVVEKAAHPELITLAASVAHQLIPPLAMLRIHETLTYYVYVMDRE